MSSKTKIVVLHMKEVIYTAIFVVLGILLIFLLVFMFLPRNKEADDTLPTMKYVAGVYHTSIQLNDSAIDVEVVVDENHINSIRLVNLNEAVTTMYPLVQPALEELSAQVYANQSLDGITYSDDNKYTSMVLLNAIETSLSKAEIPAEDPEKREK